MANQKNARVKGAVSHKMKMHSSKHLKAYKRRAMMAILDIPTEREQQIKQAAYEKKREMLIADAKY